MKDEPEEKEADMLGRRWYAALGRFRLWRGRGLVHNRAVGEGRIRFGGLCLREH